MSRAGGRRGVSVHVFYQKEGAVSVLPRFRKLFGSFSGAFRELFGSFPEEAED